MKDPLARRDPDPTELEIYGTNGHNGIAFQCRSPERRSQPQSVPREIPVHSLVILKKDHREYRG